MVIPFSNTKLRVPKGFQSLLVGLSTEVLRSQPRNIHEFAADYFEKLLQRRDQGQSYLPEKQSSLEDRYYNNQSFQEEYPVNDPEVNHAATKIQAKFRGHKARQNVEKLKQETKTIVDADQQDVGYAREESATPNKDENQTAAYDQQQEEKSSPLQSSRSQAAKEPEIDKSQPEIEPNQEFPEELTEEEKEEQERAARSIQARFRGFKAQRSGNQSPKTPEQHSARQPNPESDNEKTSTPSSARFSGKLDSDRQDLGGNVTGNDQDETGENDDTDRPRLEREPTQLSEDFERHTQIPRDSDFEREQRPDLSIDQDDMNDPTLDKAATRIQASFRGYKTRKELGSGSPQDQQQHPTSASPPAHDEDDQTHTKEGNKDLDIEEDDNAAAVKIQAAYRGYKTRKDLEK